ncbi:MAG: hypothetical protein ACP5OK_09395 [Thermoprotei archaeon]
MQIKYIVLVIMMLILLLILYARPIYGTFCYNEFSSDLIWIYVEAYISGVSPSSSSGYSFIDSGGSCLPGTHGALRVKIFNEYVVYPNICVEVNKQYGFIWNPPSGNYIGTAIVQNLCTGDDPVSHVSCVAFLNGACAI